MNTETPAYLETLSINQRAKLLTFIARADSIIGDGDFDPDPNEAWTDPEIMALALRGATVLGYSDERLEELFRCEFGIDGVTDGEGELGTWLAILALADVEKRIMTAAGGKN